MRFVCDSCSAQYMISDEKVGPKGVKVRCKKCGFVILVKKGGAPVPQAAPRPAPNPAPAPPAAALGNDPDDGLATQVMQNPLVENPAATLPSSEPDATNPGLASNPGEPKPNEGLFGGVDEDEIGAVFDQVLNSGAHSISNESAQKKAAPQGSLGDDSDDRMSTRVLDAETVRKLAEDSGAAPLGVAPASAQAPEKKDDVPQTDWFVAIDDKQTGPLTIEQIKTHWEAGEVGPDSLCWRAGFDDWLPLSEVQMLASVLAPRPTKPVVVAHTPPVSAPPSVVSMPVESAFSAGAGVAASVRGEVAVALGAPPTTPEETGSWRPSAASALASLVKEEMEALAKPVTPKRAEGTDEVSVKGLLDVPPASELSPVPATNGAARNGAYAPAPAPRPPPPANPYTANPGATYSSPGVSQYRPPSNRNLIIGIGAAVTVVVLALMATVVWLATRPPVLAQPQQVAPLQPVAAVQPPPAQPPPVAPAVAQPVPTAPVAVAPVAQPPVAPVAPPPVAVAAAPVAPPKRTQGTPTRVAASERPAPQAREPKDDPPAKTRAPEPEKDSFDDVFGTGKKDVPKQGTEAPAAKKGGGYIPPAPGSGGDMLEKLAQSDVLEVVNTKKPELVKCAEEQHSREPGVKGKLKMKWTIKTDGRTTGVSVVSEEFKSTYMAGCVGGLIKTWQFPKHKIAGEPIVFPFGF